MSGDAACAPRCCTDDEDDGDQGEESERRPQGTRPIATQTTAPPRNAGSNLAKGSTTFGVCPGSQAPTVAQATTDPANATTIGQCQPHHGQADHKPSEQVIRSAEQTVPGADGTADGVPATLVLRSLLRVG